MITLNGKKYEVPATYKIVMDDAEGQTAKIAVIHANREQYYADTYGNGKHVDVTKVVSAALGREVTLEIIEDDKYGIVAATNDGIAVTIRQAELKQTKKKKVQKPNDDVEVDATDEDV